MVRGLLILIVFMQLHAAEVTPQMLQSMRSRQRVDVVMKDGATWTGQLGEVGAATFEVQPEKRGTAVRELSYQDVSEVRRKMTKTAKWTLVGVIWGGLTLMGALIGG